MSQKELAFAYAILRASAPFILIGFVLLIWDAGSVIFAYSGSSNDPSQSLPSALGRAEIISPNYLPPLFTPTRRPAPIVSRIATKALFVPASPTPTSLKSATQAPVTGRSVVSTSTPLRIPTRRDRLPRQLSSYVDAVNSSDITGDGSSNFPWKIITYALSQMAGTGLELYFAPGTYHQALGETFPIRMKSGIGVLGYNNKESILSGMALAPVVLFADTAFATTTVLSGLKITGGLDGVRIDGIPGQGKSPTIHANSVISNSEFGIHIVADYGRNIYAVISRKFASVPRGMIVITDRRVPLWNLRILAITRLSVNTT